jgi:iron complex outermembrane receptor protein
MKYIKLLILVIFLTNMSCVYSQELKGKVFDKNTNEALIGVIIYVSDLKTGAVTDINGQYKLQNLPRQKFLVQVKLIGYATITTGIDFSLETEKDFYLQASAIEGNEVVITGTAVSSDNDRNSTSVVVIDKNKLLTEPALNIIDVIAHVPGVSQITTGGNVSKPVIRGLGYNRIVVLNEGVRQEGQQWGDEHGIEIDKYSAERIEILKGPSSLLYGSDAMGGVINFLEPIPPPVNSIQGEARSEYSTNERLYGNSLMLEGNVKGLSARVRGSFRSAASYSNPVERVFNSGYNEADLNGFAGLNKTWGYSHFHFSSYNTNIGLIEGARDSLNHFLNADGKTVSSEELNSRALQLPFQNVGHTKYTLVNRFILGKTQLAVNAGFQENQRKEYALSNMDPGIWMKLKTINYDSKFYFPEYKKWEIVAGAAGMRQMNQNRGGELLIPDFISDDAGGFIYTKKNWDKTTMNMGLRYDLRILNMVKTDSLFPADKKIFSAFTGSLGFTYRIDSVFNLKANLGRGFRAPNISELSANGVHEGTFRYEIGNKSLKPEVSLQGDISITAERPRFTAELNLFRNQIDNFIYYTNTNGETNLVDNISYPVFRYVQGVAVLYGFEFGMDVHLFYNLHFENNVSYVLGQNTSADKALPFMPPVQVHNELRWDTKFIKNKRFTESFIYLGIDNHFRQSRVDLDFETSTKDYHVLNAGMGTGIKLGKQIIQITLSAENLMNEKYIEHLNRLKYVLDNNGNGIYNRGRSFVISVNVPFGLKG